MSLTARDGLQMLSCEELKRLKSGESLYHRYVRLVRLFLASASLRFSDLLCILSVFFLVIFFFIFFLFFSLLRWFGSACPQAPHSFFFLVLFIFCFFVCWLSNSDASGSFLPVQVIANTGESLTLRYHNSLNSSQNKDFISNYIKESHKFARTAKQPKSVVYKGANALEYTRQTNSNRAKMTKVLHTNQTRQMKQVKQMKQTRRGERQLSAMEKKHEMACVRAQVEQKRSEQYPTRPGEQICNKYTVGDVVQVMYEYNKSCVADVMDCQANWVVVRLRHPPPALIKYNVMEEQHARMIRLLQRRSYEEEIAAFNKSLLEHPQLKLVEIYKHGDDNSLARCFASAVYKNADEFDLVRYECYKYVCNNLKAFKRLAAGSGMYDIVDIVAFSHVYDIQVKVMELDHGNEKVRVVFEYPQRNHGKNFVILSRHKHRFYNVVIIKDEIVRKHASLVGM